MTREEAEALLNIIQCDAPRLKPDIQRIGNGEYVIRTVTHVYFFGIKEWTSVRHPMPREAVLV